MYLLARAHLAYPPGADRLIVRAFGSRALAYADAGVDRGDGFQVATARGPRILVRRSQDRAQLHMAVARGLARWVLAQPWAGTHGSIEQLAEALLLPDLAAQMMRSMRFDARTVAAMLVIPMDVAERRLSNVSADRSGEYLTTLGRALREGQAAE